MEQKLGLLPRVLLIVAGALSIVIGALLWLFPDRTADYFAWTIANPLTAVHMGASYLAGAGTFAALRDGRWQAARVQFPFMLAFGTLQLLATVLHLASYNFAHALAWAWLITYAVSAPLALVIYVLYERREPAPVYLRSETPGAPFTLLRGLAALHVLLGLALFLFPGEMARLWPWSLTSLTARVLAGWYIAGGVSTWVRLSQPSAPVGQVGQIAGFLALPLLLIGVYRFRTYLAGPPLSVALYLVDALLAGALLVIAALRARGIIASSH